MIISQALCDANPAHAINYICTESWTSYLLTNSYRLKKKPKQNQKQNKHQQHGKSVYSDNIFTYSIQEHCEVTKMWEQSGPDRTARWDAYLLHSGSSPPTADEWVDDGHWSPPDVPRASTSAPRSLWVASSRRVCPAPVSPSFACCPFYTRTQLL